MIGQIPTGKYVRRFENRGMRPYFSTVFFESFGRIMPEWLGFRYEKMIFLVSNKMSNQAFFEEGELEAATKHFDRIWRDEVKTKEILHKSRLAFKEAIKLERSARTDWSSVGTEELLELTQNYYKVMIEVFSRMNVSQPQHVVSLEERLEKLLASQTNKEEMLKATTSYSGKLPWDDEDKEIAKLYGQWRQMSNVEQQKSLDKLVRSYGWLNAVEGDELFEHEHYRQKIVNYEEQAEDHKTLIVDLPDEVQRIGRLIGELGHLRLWARYHWMYVRYYLKSMLKELVKRSDLPQLEFATVQEIVKFFDGEIVDVDSIGTRQRGYAAYASNGVIEFATGVAYKKIQKMVRGEEQEDQVIKGAVANKGKVRGHVRVISFSSADYQDQVKAFKKGEILVTGMTRPQIVHLVKKAAAIVTDEGGITSHAAVVGREFNIPTVIGTHNATDVLKTGDEVEVDANKGIVKIIKD